MTADHAIGNRWVVTDGLRAGERLIVEGRMRAAPGAEVTPKPLTTLEPHSSDAVNPGR